jgi:hypothetical protein
MKAGIPHRQMLLTSIGFKSERASCARSAWKGAARKVQPKLTKKRIERIASEKLRLLFSPLNFVERAPGAFCRDVGRVSHGFGLSFHPSLGQFHVPVGAYVPEIKKKTNYIDFEGADYPTLLVSRWLGEFKQSHTTSDYYYRFGSVAELEALLLKVHSDFVAQAEPWLGSLSTIDDVAAEFYRRRIAPQKSDPQAPVNPFAWADYGWLLQAAGREMEARPWLERAYEYVKQPKYMQKGRLIVRSLPGSRTIPLTAEDNRLIELLEKDLGIE